MTTFIIIFISAMIGAIIYKLYILLASKFTVGLYNEFSEVCKDYHDRFEVFTAFNKCFNYHKKQSYLSDMEEITLYGFIVGYAAAVIHQRNLKQDPSIFARKPKS